MARRRPGRGDGSGDEGGDESSVVAFDTARLPLAPRSSVMRFEVVVRELRGTTAPVVRRTSPRSWGRQLRATRCISRRRRPFATPSIEVPRCWPDSFEDVEES